MIFLATGSSSSWLLGRFDDGEDDASFDDVVWKSAPSLEASVVADGDEDAGTPWLGADDDDDDVSFVWLTLLASVDGLLLEEDEIMAEVESLAISVGATAYRVKTNQVSLRYISKQ